MSKPEPSEARAADAILKDLRGRRFLKYVFDDDPANCLPYGYLEAPIDLETQREIAETLARNALSAASVAGMPSRELDVQALASVIHDARFDKGRESTHWTPFEDEGHSGKVYCLRIANAVELHLLALFASPSDGGGNG